MLRCSCSSANKGVTRNNDVDNGDSTLTTKNNNISNGSLRKQRRTTPANGATADVGPARSRGTAGNNNSSTNGIGRARRSSALGRGLDCLESSPQEGAEGS